MSKGAASRSWATGILRAALALPLGLALASPLALAGPAAAAPLPDSAGIELTPAVQRNLEQIRDQWLQWLGASDRERAGQGVDDLLATARQLGAARLPDLALGALAQATRAAAQGDLPRARWCLEAAERLDPGRPETAFAAGLVDRRTGHPVRAWGRLLDGGRRLFSLPSERYLWLQSTVLWLLGALLATGGLFVVVQMVSKGGALLRDLTRTLGKRVPARAALALAAVALLWPVLLPRGLLWLLLYWSLLLWGYGSASERVVLVSIWLLLGLAPFAIAEQRRRVEVALSPPVRAMEGLAHRRLYGGLFADLGVLRARLPDSSAVQHLMADLHRSLNQWDLARSFYRQVLEKEPENTSALINLGAYFYFKRDFGSAIENFRQAAVADPESAAARFNLSQAYGGTYNFEDQRAALADAQRLDRAQVDRWSALTEPRVVTPSGGISRIPAIQRELLALGRSREAPASRFEQVRLALALALALVMVLLAVALHLARRGFGYTAPPLDVRLGGRGLDRLRRALLPGVAAAEAGEGGRSFLALLVPVALLTLPLAGELGYRVPWGYDPGQPIAWIVALSGLVVYFAARVQRELRDQI